MKESTLVRMSFSIEAELLKELEKLIAQSGYENRSEFVRDMIRKQLTRKICSISHEVIGTVSVLCDRSFPDIENKLNEVLDNAKVKVLGSSRFMLPENCSSTMVTATGIGDNIREMVNSIRRLKGVVQAEFVITSPAGSSAGH